MSEIDHPVHQQFSDEELAAIVAEAARAERIVAAHCHGKPGIMAALRAGVPLDRARQLVLDEEAADLMVERDAMLRAHPIRRRCDLLGQAGRVYRSYAYEKGTARRRRPRAGDEDRRSRRASGSPTGCDMFVSGADVRRERPRGQRT